MQFLAGQDPNDKIAALSPATSDVSIHSLIHSTPIRIRIRILTKHPLSKNDQGREAIKEENSPFPILPTLPTFPPLTSQSLTCASLPAVATTFPTASAIASAVTPSCLAAPAPGVESRERVVLSKIEMVLSEEIEAMDVEVGERGFMS